ncbi:S24/S26 family peptidase [Bacteroides sp. GD17]|jgi:signal peptidase|uniref:S24/S26 family peptidase n=1 Tax=Bacteroides sp. GD17 TaxID=3139826 RepID=UPI0025EB4525|nr:S24/S26 family peptidase [uncultured Bacteroides sp.]
MKKSIPNEILLPEVARLIEEGHTATIIVRGNSMNPFLVDRRDRVTLGSFTPEDLQPGATVLARDTTGRIVFHRIISRKDDTLILQGDGNLAQTEETSIDQVMGLMTEAIRKEKRYSAQSKAWRRYSYWWLKLKPLRRWLLAIFRRI